MNGRIIGETVPLKSILVLPDSLTLHCSIGSKNSQPSPRLFPQSFLQKIISSTSEGTEEAVGFARLIEMGFQPEEIEEIRSQFLQVIFTLVGFSICPLMSKSRGISTSQLQDRNIIQQMEEQFLSPTLTTEERDAAQQEEQAVIDHIFFMLSLFIDLGRVWDTYGYASGTNRGIFLQSFHPHLSLGYT